jgi:hypothetical protein
VKLFVAFLVLCFLAGMVGRPAFASDSRARWFIAAMILVLVVGYYAFRRI